MLEVIGILQSYGKCNIFQRSLIVYHEEFVNWISEGWMDTKFREGFLTFFGSNMLAYEVHSLRLFMGTFYEL